MNRCKLFVKEKTPPKQRSGETSTTANPVPCTSTSYVKQEDKPKDKIEDLEVRGHLKLKPESNQDSTSPSLLNPFEKLFNSSIYLQYVRESNV